MTAPPGVLAYCRPCGQLALYAYNQTYGTRDAFMLDPKPGGGPWTLCPDGLYRRVRGSTEGHKLHGCPKKPSSDYWLQGKEVCSNPTES